MSNCLTLKKSNCKNCYKCIRNCPVKSIRFSGNQAHIISDECILCGTCFVVCPQNAKEISSEMEKVRVLLQGPEHVYVSLAPSYIANFEGVGIESMREALKKLGFYDVEETALGATIVKREYERLINDDTRDIVISSCCHSVNLLIQKYFPKALEYLADVVSPMQAHCLDIKRRDPEAKTVFIGPCVAKKDEAEKYPGIVDAVLTFEELSQWLAEDRIELEVKTEPSEEGLARFFPTTGGVLKTLTAKNPNYSYLAIDGVENCIAALKDVVSGKIHRCFIEMSACVGSCIGGPIMEKYHNNPVGHYIAVSRFAGDKDFAIDQPKDSELRKSFSSIDHHAIMPSEMEIAAVLREMGKFTKAQELNCGTCGYSTCRDKAIAVCQGKAEVSMCLPYLKDKAESFSDTIIKNTPNGLIAVNEDLEVQQINTSALRMLNLRSASDVLGDQVVRILDPVPFIQAKSSRFNFNERRFLAEYNRYVDETIVYDRDSHILLCILRDVTDEALAEERKDEISRQTVEVADKVVEKQMRIVQEIASLLGETAAETKIALTKLKESIKQ